jgi:hypothetical protein
MLAKWVHSLISIELQMNAYILVSFKKYSGLQQKESHGKAPKQLI